jgi:hypothetical protein
MVLIDKLPRLVLHFHVGLRQLVHFRILLLHGTRPHFLLLTAEHLVSAEKLTSSDSRAKRFR